MNGLKFVKRFNLINNVLEHGGKTKYFSALKLPGKKNNRSNLYY